MQATVRQLRDALAHLHDLPYLQTHPLAVGPGGGKALRRALLDAVDALGNGSAGQPGRLHRLLVLRYVEGLEPAAVQRGLGLASSQYYAEQTRAIEAVGSVLRGDTVSGPTRALPIPPTSFLGREPDLAALRALLASAEAPAARLVTLVGPPGTGKTRLALEAAAELGPSFPGGAVWVPLAAVVDPDDVLPRIAAALGAVESATEPLASVLRRAIGPRRLLLVLDNCEQVLGAAPAIGELLALCRGLSLLATSREPLGIAGERELPLEPLDDAAARELFADRASAGRPVRPVEAGDPAVGELCRRLDNLPLAIELTAGWTRVLEPAEIARRLEGRLDLVAAERRDLPERQRTLRAALDWSEKLLTDDERRLFARLSVFVGGWTIEEAEAVCGGDDVLGGLCSLTAKCLVRADDDRFTMLHVVRQYAAERLAELDGAAEFAERHARYYLALAEEAMLGLDGPDGYAWFDRVDDELGNVRASLRWALDRRETKAGLRATAGLLIYWLARGYWREGADWVAELLAFHPTRDAARSAGLAAEAHLRPKTADGRERQLAGEALDIARELRGSGQPASPNDPWNRLSVEANALCAFAWVHSFDAPPASRVGGELYGEAVALYRQLGWDAKVAVHQAFGAWTLARAGEIERALASSLEALEVSRRPTVGPRARAQALEQRARVLYTADRPLEARPLIEESNALRRRLGHRGGLVYAVAFQSRLLARLGELDGAQAAARETIELLRPIGDRAFLPVIGLVGCGIVAAARGEFARAVRLGAAAFQLWGGSIMPLSDQGDRGAWVAGARAALDPAEAEAAWAEGLAMEADAACDYALAEMN